jgi:hypothetical protein
MARPAAPGLFICSMAWLRFLCLPTLAQRIRQATVPPIDFSDGDYSGKPPDLERQSSPEKPQPVAPHDPLHFLRTKSVPA